MNAMASGLLQRAWGKCSSHDAQACKRLQSFLLTVRLQSTRTGHVRGQAIMILLKALESTGSYELLCVACTFSSTKHSALSFTTCYL